MKALEGRIGIVTGGSSGIGYAISNVLAEAGATVYAVSRTGKVKDGMPASALGVIHVQGDVTSKPAENSRWIFWSTTQASQKNAGPRISQQRILHISCR